MSKLIPGTSRDAVTNEDKRLNGYGAVFYRADDAGTEYFLWDDIVERIMPGAFDRAIREDDVISCFNHDPNFVLGRNKSNTLNLAIDAKGLRYSVEPSDSAMAQHVLSAVARGDVPGSSFMFQVSKATWIEEKTADGKELFIREINEVNPLMELGPVCFPAYASTTAEANARAVRADDSAPIPFRNWLEAHCRAARESLDSWKSERLNGRREKTERDKRQRRLKALKYAGA